jgi:hypothetical protein
MATYASPASSRTLFGLAAVSTAKGPFVMVDASVYEMTKVSFSNFAFLSTRQESDLVVETIQMIRKELSVLFLRRPSHRADAPLRFRRKSRHPDSISVPDGEQHRDTRAPD